MAVSHQRVAVQVQALYWYQVVFTGPKEMDVRQRVRANNPDAALRAAMREHALSFTPVAFIWRLFRHGAPSRRYNVRCRIPVARFL